jgi:hypothetical protein
MLNLAAIGSLISCTLRLAVAAMLAQFQPLFNFFSWQWA